MTDEPEQVIKVGDLQVLMQLDNVLRHGYTLHVMPDFFGKGKAALALMMEDDVIVTVPYHGRVASSVVHAVASEMDDDTEVVRKLCRAVALDIATGPEKGKAN